MRAYILYSGRVQGVGFRYTFQRHALASGLTGWVKNLPDGCVEVIVEGSKEKIEELCHNIEERFSGYIQDKKIDFNEVEENFDDFMIVS